MTEAGVCPRLRQVLRHSGRCHSRGGVTDGPGPELGTFFRQQTSRSAAQSQSLDRHGVFTVAAAAQRQLASGVSAAVTRLQRSR
eukprot:767336-Hanusia_phi.AAC.3